MITCVFPLKVMHTQLLVKEWPLCGIHTSGGPMVMTCLVVLISILAPVASQVTTPIFPHPHNEACGLQIGGHGIISLV
jgi:hypothetical protein